MHLIIELSNTYDKKCKHYAYDDIVCFVWRPAKIDSSNKHGLDILCKGGG